MCWCEVSLWLGAAREPTRPARVGLEETVTLDWSNLWGGQSPLTSVTSTPEGPGRQPVRGGLEGQDGGDGREE